MRLVAMVSIWKRPHVTRRCFRALTRLELPPGWSLDVQVAGSEGDESRALADEFGFRYIETANRRLSHKHNLNLQATAALDWDYAWLLGSDTLVSPNILADLYQPVLEQRPAWLGLRDLYLYDSLAGDLWYWPGYAFTSRRVDSIGAGRMFSRETVERTREFSRYTGGQWELWKPTLNRGLDWNCFLRLHDGLGIPETHLRHIPEEGGPDPAAFLLEYRTERQITTWRYFEVHCRPMTTGSPNAMIVEMLA